MNKTTLSSKNQIVIPKSVRQKVGLRTGDVFIFEKLSKGSFVVRKLPTYDELRGLIKQDKIDAVRRVRALRDEWDI